MIDTINFVLGANSSLLHPCMQLFLQLFIFFPQLCILFSQPPVFLIQPGNEFVLIDKLQDQLSGNHFEAFSATVSPVIFAALHVPALRAACFITDVTIFQIVIFVFATVITVYPLAPIVFTFEIPFSTTFTARFTPAVTFVGTFTTKSMSTVCTTFNGTTLAAHTLMTFFTISHWNTIRAVFSLAFSTIVQTFKSFFSFTFVAEEFSTDVATEVLAAI